METTVALVGLVFLVTGAGLAVVSTVRGRAIVEVLKVRHREAWEKMGRPRPTLHLTPEGTRFSRFILQREYAQIDDRPLVLQCEALRRYSLGVLAYVLIGFAALGATLLVIRYLDS